MFEILNFLLFGFWIIFKKLICIPDCISPCSGIHIVLCLPPFKSMHTVNWKGWKRTTGEPL